MSIPLGTSPLVQGIQASSGSQHLQGQRRTYLSLLPPAQIIEICLTFEAHAPQHVRESVWPNDLDAAIVALKEDSSSIPAQTEAGSLTSTSTHTPVTADAPLQQVHTPGQNAVLSGSPPMASLFDDVAGARQPSLRSAEESHSNPQQDRIPSAALSSSATVQPSSPQPPVASTSKVGISHTNTHYPPPHSPYPYAPYGYTAQNQSQQSAYPHTPYYPPPPPPHHLHAYPPYHYPGYPSPGYPSQPSGHAPYASYPPPPPTHGSPSHYHHAPAPASPAQPPPPPAMIDDLPSYEEMIVEALLEMGDPEGAAPKDLFTWMAARYPLQTNFRPSASQALQKAYKRGRLEKRLGGRYRLNSTWEGGATSKRTTRRPQTLAQTTYAMQHPPQPPSSPFTTAPLQSHPQHPQHPQYPQPNPSAPGQSSYPGYPYGYPPGGYPSYPGYPPYPPPNAPATAEKTIPQKKAQAGPPAEVSPVPTAPRSNVTEGEEKHTNGESGDAGAWEAAQHILQAINFGSFTLPTDGLEQAAGDAAQGSSHPPPAVAAPGTELGVAVGSSATGHIGVRMALTDEERASLQAQLALLAAQLAEIAEDEVEEGEDEVEEFVHIARSVDSAALRIPSGAEQGNTSTVGKGNAMVLDMNQFPELFSAGGGGIHQAAPMEVEDTPAVGVSAEEEESDDDDDMEMIEVPTLVGEALQT
ncbi:uncharacterized protein FIBRA_07122 [Fibroporia radiculosa]|uniref:Histone H1 n=1 Tax=Fibroporia radiculosa TaxID=599839 RepID=J4GUD8_9APHY|nr:uncharacterized protein FIBRA_07122 [Fibroporia radiculosa]CCM04925.1 predicted protein [Fibroporia radiculosa]